MTHSTINILFGLLGLTNGQGKTLKTLLITIMLLVSGASLANQGEQILDELEKKQALGFDPTSGGGGSVRFPPHPRRMADYDVGIEKKEKFSAQVQLEFGGAKFKAGPSITFNRKYSMTVYIMGGGTESLVEDFGDYGSVLNIREDRDVISWCTVRTSASHNLNMGGSLTFFGTGVTVEANTWESLNVSQTSEPFYVQKYREGSTYTTLEDIISDCKRNFFHQVKPSLDEDLRRLTSQLVYNHEQTECAEDYHCEDYLKNQKNRAKRNSVARCVPTKVGDGEVVKLCRLRGVENRSCPIYNDKGRQLNTKKSIPCDEDYKCVTTVKGGWFRYPYQVYTSWEAACKPASQVVARNGGGW